MPILGNDFNLALAALLLATVMVLVGNLAADLAYAARPADLLPMNHWRDALRDKRVAISGRCC